MTPPITRPPTTAVECRNRRRRNIILRRFDQQQAVVRTGEIDEALSDQEIDRVIGAERKTPAVATDSMTVTVGATNYCPAATSNLAGEHGHDAGIEVVGAEFRRCHRRLVRYVYATSKNTEAAQGGPDETPQSARGADQGQVNVPAIHSLKVL